MTYKVTTTGLTEPGAAAATLADINWAVAAGSANVITAAYDTANTELTDGLILGFRASAANTTATPTFSPDGLTAHPITRDGGSSLQAGDIAAAGFEALIRYKLASTRWELLNPARANLSYTWIAGGGSADAIAATYAPAVLSLVDGMLLRVRATAANTTTTPTFAPNGLTAYIIYKAGGQALLAGDIYGAGHELLLVYRSSATRWELLNPSSVANTTAAIATANALRDELGKYIVTDVAGLDVNTAQPWFPSAGAVTLPVGTYRFRGQLYTTRSGGANSHTTGVLFAGTATTSVINFFALAMTGDANTLVALSGFRLVGGTTLPSTSLVVKAASTSTTENTMIEVEGIVTVTVAGTFIPEFIYSAAPGNGTTGIPQIKAGSFFLLKPLVANPSGTWA